MDFTLILEQMIILFLLMVVGFTANRLKVMDAVTNAHLTRLVLNISLPAMLITSVSGGVGEFAKSELLRLFLLSGLSYLVMGAAAFLAAALMRCRRADRGTYTAMMFFGNVGFMGFPVISAIFGPETIFYGAIYNVVFSLIAFSLGIRLIGPAEAKFSPKSLVNAVMVASLGAIVLFLFDVTLPPVLGNTLGYLGDITTPAAMLLLGSSLAEMEIKEVFTGWRVYVVTGVKLVAIPLAVYFVLGLFVTDPTLLGVLVVLAATPTASTVTMLAIRYEGNQKLASRGIFFSTLLSVATIPLLVYLLFV